MSEVITVTISDRLADIDQVMQVVYDGYLEAGYISPNPMGRRMLPHYLTPGAAFILAAVDGEPAGALACVPDGPWGCPSDEAFPQEFELLRSSRRLVECGSMSVRKEFRSVNHRIALSLMAVAIRYLYEAEDDPQVVVTVAPEKERFHRSLLSAERYGEVVNLYGEPAVLLSAPTSQLIDGLRLGPSPTRRAVSDLVFDPEPEWLLDVRYPRADRPDVVAA